jgi:hypothetical protein
MFNKCFILNKTTVAYMGRRYNTYFGRIIPYFSFYKSSREDLSELYILNLNKFKTYIKKIYKEYHLPIYYKNNAPTHQYGDELVVLLIICIKFDENFIPNITRTNVLERMKKIIDSFQDPIFQKRFEFLYMDFEKVEKRSLQLRLFRLFAKLASILDVPNKSIQTINDFIFSTNIYTSYVFYEFHSYRNYLLDYYIYNYFIRELQIQNSDSVFQAYTSGGALLLEVNKYTNNLIGFEPRELLYIIKKTAVSMSPNSEILKLYSDIQNIQEQSKVDKVIITPPLNIKNNQDIVLTTLEILKSHGSGFLIIPCLEFIHELKNQILNQITITKIFICNYYELDRDYYGGTGYYTLVIFFVKEPHANKIIQVCTNVLRSRYQWEYHYEDILFDFNQTRENELSNYIIQLIKHDYNSNTKNEYYNHSREKLKELKFLMSLDNSPELQS